MSYQKSATLGTSIPGPDSMEIMAHAMLPDLGRGLLASPALPAQIGEIVADKYRLDRVIGQGSMGVVVQASHIRLGHRVAIKFMLPKAGGAGAVRRFEHEARTTCQLRSEHVARVTDFGTLPNGSPYIIAEYLEGTDLDSLLSLRGPLPVTQAATYVGQACEAIAEAHALGIVHRDLKPQNLFLTHRINGTPCVKVLDFGVAKSLLAITGNGGLVTAVGSLVGSPAYMAPEQVEAQPVDERTDIWALGVCLYQLVSGAFPFVAPTVGLLCVKILNVPPVPLRERAPHVPIEFEAVVHRCLARAPAERFATVADLARALYPLAFSHPRSAQVHPAVAATQTTQRTARPGPIAGIVLGGLAAVGVAAVSVGVLAHRVRHERAAPLGLVPPAPAATPLRTSVPGPTTLAVACAPPQVDVADPPSSHAPSPLPRPRSEGGERTFVATVPARGAPTVASAPAAAPAEARASAKERAPDEPEFLFNK
jgi:serine/threonine protein kinase